ncbi:cytosol aminopeptidase-like [Agrilus planipennis]|uniref:Cytosol aminopeptidase n=1 Tax=Agrilus planipennis TaxID=224129 RepID=A0A1W4WWW8_AGRPL|nr:cytosol aminopeptidase-like [Agrilus planipennis]
MNNVFRLFKSPFQTFKFNVQLWKYKNRLKIVRNFCSGGDGGCEPERKGIILGVYEGDNGEPILSSAAKKYNDCTDGKFFELIKSSGTTLKVGEALLFTNLDTEFCAVAAVGLGHPNLCYNELECIDEGTEASRRAAGAGIQRLKMSRLHRVLIEGLGHPEQAAEGAALALWRYQDNKLHKSMIPSIELHDDPDTESFQRGLFKAECQNLARRLSDTPGNQMTPLHFAQETVNELCPCGIKVEVHDKDWIESKKMNAFLTVARGSCEPPIFLELHYCGEPADVKPIMLAAKGITFDSGGLSLKRTRIMSDNRGDMAGAAIIVAVMKAVAALSIPLNITGLIPLCENMPSGMAMKPGDVVCGLNGKTIMIEDADHEGRMLLADTFVYGQGTFKPRMVIDFATLMPGTEGAIGSSASSVFTNSENLWAQVRKASVITGDRVWRFPIWEYFGKKLRKFPSHDVDNRGEGAVNACNATAFLREFLQCVDWMHVDITNSGMVMKNKNISYLTKRRMTGRPTRTIIQLLYQLANPSEQKPKC